MKGINVAYLLAAILILELLLSTVAYDEPSFRTASEERFSVSKITQNQAVHVIGEKWSIVNSSNYLEMSMTKTSAFERSIYDVAIPINAPLVAGAIVHARLFVSTKNANGYLARAFVVLANETHVVELSYCIGEKLNDEIPDPSVPTYSYLYMHLSNVSNIWITAERNLVADLAAKNVTTGTNGHWKIVTFLVGGILFPKNETWTFSILVDLNQTYMALGETKVYTGNASLRTPILISIGGLCLLSLIVLVVYGIVFKRRNKMQ